MLTTFFYAEARRFSGASFPSFFFDITSSLTPGVLFYELLDSLVFLFSGREFPRLCSARRPSQLPAGKTRSGPFFGATIVPFFFSIPDLSKFSPRPRSPLSVFFAFGAISRKAYPQNPFSFWNRDRSPTFQSCFFSKMSRFFPPQKAYLSTPSPSCFGRRASSKGRSIAFILEGPDYTPKVTAKVLAPRPAPVQVL